MAQVGSVEEVDHLRQKVQLLVQRERELFELRAKHDQLALWLKLGQALPTLFLERSQSSTRIWGGVRKALIGNLRLQRVLINEEQGNQLSPLTGRGESTELPSEAVALLADRSSGYCNDGDADDTDPPLRALASALGLNRFMWSHILEPRGARVLVAAGFDRAKAVFQGTFDDVDAAHFRNAMKHLESLLSNYLLFAELEVETHKLQQANDTLLERDQELRRAAEQLRAANESLEERVAHRTQELAGKNRELSLVLDNVDQALLTIDLQGRLAPGRSRAVKAWFGPSPALVNFVDYIKPDPAFADLLDLGLQALEDDYLPRELALGQLPKQFVRDSRTYACRFLPIDENGKLAGLLVVIDDVTDKLAKAKEEAEQRELLAAFRALMNDRNGLLIFLAESERILSELKRAGSDLALTKRLLHTLKGNASTFDLQTLATLCHEAETELDEENGVQPETLERLYAQWADVSRRLSGIMPTDTRGLVQVSETDLDRLVKTARDGAAREVIVERIARLRWEPLTGPLGRLARHAEALADRLGKGPLQVEVEAAGVRLDPEHWAPLWSALVHVVRNAVDHGIEPFTERLASGKPRHGHLRLSGHRKRQGYLIKIADDGRGINWARIGQICEARGQRAESRAELVQALFSVGFTTRENVSNTSGRGVGLAAVATTVADLGGQISVESESGLGTCWTLLFPEADVDCGA